jgi:hypothetical protein
MNSGTNFSVDWAVFHAVDWDADKTTSWAVDWPVRWAVDNALDSAVAGIIREVIEWAGAMEPEQPHLQDFLREVGVEV